MIFDTTHTLYILFSLLFTVCILFISKKFIKSEKNKLRFLRFFSLGTFLLHISIIWTTYLTSENNYGYAYDNILFPIYFCNLAMYCLLICSFINTKKKYYAAFATFTAWAGILGSLISLFYPDYYLNTPTLKDWSVLKSMLSHSTMLIGTLYLFVGNYIKLDIKNLLYYSYGLIGCLIVGLFNNLFLGLFGRDMNSMYLKRPPLDDVPYLNFITIPLLMLFIIFISILVKRLIVIRYKKQEVSWDAPLSEIET
ncbi:MAG: YwaF family protein [Candidatus Cloacimonetes bacterium]|nr:YwaF family protein [Candidatus Cloacimonadota bacterium]